jgi:hypothetical protein
MNPGDSNMFCFPEKENDYTLLFFGGRQPLCGNGVTSFIITTSIPDCDRERMAPSRPEPGPLHKRPLFLNLRQMQF